MQIPCIGFGTCSDKYWHPLWLKYNCGVLLSKTKRNQLIWDMEIWLFHCWSIGKLLWTKITCYPYRKETKPKQFQELPQLCCPSLERFQPLNVSFDTKGPDLTLGWEVQQCSRCWAIIHAVRWINQNRFKAEDVFCA